MKRHLLIPALALLAGCASSKPDLGNDVAETESLVREAETLAHGETATAYVSIARDRQAAARAAMEAESEDADLLLEEARAAAQASLAAGAADRRREEAENCLTAAAQARREWQDAVRLLEQTEKVADQEARGVERTEPEEPPAVMTPDDPPSPADTVLSRGAVREASQAWGEAAVAQGVPVADLTARIDRALATNGDPKVEPATQEAQARLAAWAAVEMAHRVEADASRRQCLTALDRARLFSSYRDHALFSMVELERGMKEGMRGQLEEERARLEERQKNLYDSLKQFEGKFATIRQEARGTIMSLSDILFDTGKSALRREAEINLAKVAVILTQYPEMAIEVEGHTDNVGAEDYNQKLSERRAEAVAAFLAEQSVARERMQTHGYGMSQPVESNAAPEGRQANRRVDLVIRETSGAAPQKP